MKRKLIAVLLCFTMIFSFGLTACDSIGLKSPCKHEYTEETFLQATCISEGVLKRTCSLCGMQTCEKTDKTEHTYENGLCTTCNTADPSFSGTITIEPDDPALDLGDCKHTTVTTYTMEPTCNREGGKVEQCNSCGRIAYLEAYPATGDHAWEEFIEEPTCISDGLKYKECQECNAMQFVAVMKKLGHARENGVCSRCGDGKSNIGAGVVETYDGSAVTVTFYHTMGANLRSVLDTYIPKFNELYPNITIEHQSAGDYPALRDQIATELTAGNAPSLAYCYGDHVALYNKAQAVMPMDEYIAHDTMGLTYAQIADFIPCFYNEGKSFDDGKMYMLPVTKSTEVLYYNKTFFEQHNLTVPTTWDEMEVLCAQIKTIDPNCIPLGYDSEANWFITMTEQLKSGYTTIDGDKFVFDTDANYAFVEKLRNWYKAGYVTTEEIYGNYTSGLFTETDIGRCKSYMCIGSSAGASYQCPDANSDGSYPFEVGVAMIPQADANNKKVIQQGPSLCMFKKSNAQEMAAAWLFAKYLTTTVEFQAQFSMTNGYTPVIQSAVEHPVYQEYLNRGDGNRCLSATVIKQTLAQKDYYFFSPAFNGSSAARDAVGALLQSCFVNDPVAGQSVADFIKAEFKKSIDTLKYDYGY